MGEPQSPAAAVGLTAAVTTATRHERMLDGQLARSRELAVKPYHFDHNSTAEVDDALACYERSHAAIVGLAATAT